MCYKGAKKLFDFFGFEIADNADKQIQHCRMHSVTVRQKTSIKTRFQVSKKRMLQNQESIQDILRQLRQESRERKNKCQDGHSCGFIEGLETEWNEGS
jgi:hypothetical protein